MNVKKKSFGYLLIGLGIIIIMVYVGGDIAQKTTPKAETRGGGFDFDTFTAIYTYQNNDNEKYDLMRATERLKIELIINNKIYDEGILRLVTRVSDGFNSPQVFTENIPGLEKVKILTLQLMFH